MNKCKGCGIKLQSKDSNLPGYTPNIDNKLCQRCFKITNYNYHEIESKYLDNNIICESINNKKAFTFFLCDFLALNQNTIDLYNKIKYSKIFVITKSDIISNNIKMDLLKERIKKVYNLDDLLFISIKNGYGKKEIFEYINTYKKVLFAGPSSSGKSSLINYLFNYELTVSEYKNTTQDFISLKIDDIIVYDAPGFNFDYLKEYKVSGFVNANTVVLKKGYELVIDDIVISSNENINLTIYLPKVFRYVTRKIRNENNNILKIDDNTDLTLNNIGFIYFKNKCEIKINKTDKTSIRNSIVGGK